MGFMTINENQLASLQGFTAQQRDQCGDAKGVTSSANANDFCGMSHFYAFAAFDFDWR
jgi:hypothetical protein